MFTNGEKREYARKLYIASIMSKTILEFERNVKKFNACSFLNLRHLEIYTIPQLIKQFTHYAHCCCAKSKWLILFFL